MFALLGSKYSREYYSEPVPPSPDCSCKGRGTMLADPKSMPCRCTFRLHKMSDLSRTKRWKRIARNEWYSLKAQPGWARFYCGRYYRRAKRKLFKTKAV